MTRLQLVPVWTDAHSYDLARGGESNSVHQTGASIQLEHPGFEPPRGLGHGHGLDLGVGLGLGLGLGVDHGLGVGLALSLDLDRDASWTAA